MPHGRMTKLTPSLQAAICTAVAAGVPLISAARLAGIAKPTVLAWLQRGEGTHPTLPARQPYIDFADQIAQARARDEATRIARINQAGRGGAVVYRKTQETVNGQGEVTRRVLEERFKEPEWGADAWHLERAYPDVWGRRERMDLRLTVEQVYGRVAQELGLETQSILQQAVGILQERDNGDSR